MAQLIVDNNGISSFVDNTGTVAFVDDVGNFTQTTLLVAPLFLRLHLSWIILVNVIFALSDAVFRGVT